MHNRIEIEQQIHYSNANSLVYLSAKETISMYVAFHVIPIQ